MVAALTFSLAAMADITLMFQQPEGTECEPMLEWTGNNTTPSWSPGGEGNILGEPQGEGLYVFTLPYYGEGTFQGKILAGTVTTRAAGWNEANELTIEPEVPGASLDGNQFVFSGVADGVTINVTCGAWKDDYNPCVSPVPAGTASFTATMDLTEAYEKEIDMDKVALIVMGMGDNQGWGEIGRIYFDSRSETFNGELDVPQNCVYKYQIAYPAEKDPSDDCYETREGNRKMTNELLVNDEIEGWNTDPFAAFVTFSIEPNKIATPNESVTFIAEASGMGEDVTYTYTIEGAQLTVDEDNTWTPATDGYTEGAYTVVVTAQDDVDVVEASASIVIGEVAPITVKLQASSLPEGWGDVVNLHTWGDASTDWPGNPVELDGEWYTYAFDESVANVNIIWNNGNGMQTEDITSVTESTCYAIGEDLGDGKFAAQVVDCPSTAAEGTTADAVMSQKVIIGGTRYIIAGETIYEGLY